MSPSRCPSVQHPGSHSFLDDASCTVCGSRQFLGKSPWQKFIVFAVPKLVRPTSIDMSDEEEDPEIFLAGIAARSSSGSKTYSQRRREAQLQSEIRNLAGRARSKKEIERENLEALKEGMGTSLFEREKLGQVEGPSTKRRTWWPRWVSSQDRLWGSNEAPFQEQRVRVCFQRKATRLFLAESVCAVSWRA